MRNRVSSARTDCERPTLGAAIGRDVDGSATSHGQRFGSESFRFNISKTQSIDSPWGRADDVSNHFPFLCLFFLGGFLLQVMEKKSAQREVC